MKARVRSRCAVIGSLLCIAACGAPSDASSRVATATDSARGSDSSSVDLLGAGATFPYPLYSRWFNRFAQDSGIRINYLSIGSGGGIDQLIADSVHFGASDVPMTDAEIARAPGARVVHIPMALGAVALTYQLEGLARPLRLTPSVIAELFLGAITTWNDPRLAALNPDLALPDDSVRVIHRADASGTSFIFSDYLSTVSEAWANGPGRGKDIVWPVGVGGNGNAGVAAQVKQTRGAIGYVEGNYARLNRLPVARVQNAAGAFVAPAAFEIASAAVNVLDAVQEPADLRVSLVNAPGRQSYPIASFSWLLVAPSALTSMETQQLLRFLQWALTDGERTARELGFEPLPTVLAERVLASTRAQLQPAASRR